MKTPVTYIRCEYCNALIDYVSPPTPDQYEKAQIYIKDGTLLLPKLVVEHNDTGGGHAKSLDGYYCGPECLVKQIRKHLSCPEKVAASEFVV